MNGLNPEPPVALGVQEVPILTLPWALMLATAYVPSSPTSSPSSISTLMSSSSTSSSSTYRQWEWLLWQMSLDLSGWHPCPISATLQLVDCPTRHYFRVDTWHCCMTEPGSTGEEKQMPAHQASGPCGTELHAVWPCWLLRYCQRSEPVHMTIVSGHPSSVASGNHSVEYPGQGHHLWVLSA